MNPDKMGINNYIQHALNTEAGEQLKDSNVFSDDNEVMVT